MTRDMRGLLWLLLAATGAVALLLGAFVAWIFAEALPPGTAVVIDGRRFLLHDALPAGAGGWLLVMLGLLMVALLLVVVVPLVLTLALLVPAVAGALGVALGLAVALGVLALLAAPPVLLARWLWRRSRAAQAAQPRPL